MLAAHDKIELLVQDPTDGRWRLIAVAEAGEWEDPQALWHLQEKFNVFAIYALDGEMRRQYPESAGRPVTFVLSSVDPIPAAALALVEQMRPILGAEGLTIETKRTDPQPPKQQAA